MDIDDLVGKVIHKISRKNLHVASEYDGVDFVLAQQCDLFFFLSGLGIGGDRDVVKRNAKLLSDGFEVSAVADDDRDVHLQITTLMAGKQIIEAVAVAGDQKSHLGADIAEVQ